MPEIVSYCLQGVFFGENGAILSILSDVIQVWHGLCDKGVNNKQKRFIVKTKLMPAIAFSLVGFFASASLAQEDAPVVDQPAVSEEVATEAADVKADKATKEDPRADRAKERFERKDAKKAEIANHKAEKDAQKAEKKALKDERKAEKDAQKAEKKALKDERKAEKDAQKAEKKALMDERKAEKKAAKEERKADCQKD